MRTKPRMCCSAEASSILPQRQQAAVVSQEMPQQLQEQRKALVVGTRGGVAGRLARGTGSLSSSREGAAQSRGWRSPSSQAATARRHLEGRGSAPQLEQLDGRAERELVLGPAVAAGQLRWSSHPPWPAAAQRVPWRSPRQARHRRSGGPVRLVSTHAQAPRAEAELQTALLLGFGSGHAAG